MTVKTVLNERETLKGKGKILHPKNGQQLAEVAYTVVLYDEFEETFGTDRMKVDGGGQVKVFIAHAEVLNLDSVQLTLELEDGRRVTGLFKRYSGGRFHLVQRGGFDEL